MPFGPGAPCGVVEKLYARQQCVRKGFAGENLNSFFAHRFVHISLRVCPQGVPKVIHKACVLHR